MALAERLHQLAGFGRVFFCNSGAEAIEAAIKLARRRAGTRGGPAKHEIVVPRARVPRPHPGHAGRRRAEAKRAPFEPVAGGFRHVARNDVDALRGRRRPAHRRHPGRAGAGRGRRLAAHAPSSWPRPRALRPPRRAAPVRRGADRHRPLAAPGSPSRPRPSARTPSRSPRASAPACRSAR